jgi:diacylglycerol kinase
MEAITGFFNSLYTAFQGIVYVIKVERNARLHLIIAVITLVFAVALQVTNAELAAIFFAIILVFTAEIVNTALEKMLDLIEPEFNDQVRVIKDIAAGAVLVSAIGAAAIGLAIFAPYILEHLWRR